MNETIPIHNNNGVNNHYCNKKMYFHASESRELWLKNIQNPDTLAYFKQYGWEDDHSIEYQYNSHGFRTDEFDLTPRFLALGCSFTEGIGLPTEKIWHGILEKQLKVKFWNLGVGGSSLDTCFRLLNYYIHKLNVIAVFLLQPPNNRFELFVDGRPITYMPLQDNTSATYKQWVIDEHNLIINAEKNLLAIENLCNKKKIPLYTRYFNELNGGGTDRARDMLHHGPRCHEHLAELFYTEYNNV